MISNRFCQKGFKNIIRTANEAFFQTYSKFNNKHIKFCWEQRSTNLKNTNSFVVFQLIFVFCLHYS